MVDNKFRVEQLNNPRKPMDNPNLISKKSMSAWATTASKGSDRLHITKYSQRLIMQKQSLVKQKYY